MPLHHGDLAAPAAQMQRGSESGESRADHDDVIGATRNAANARCRPLGAEAGHIQQRRRGVMIDHAAIQRLSRLLNAARDEFFDPLDRPGGDDQCPPLVKGGLVKSLAGHQFAQLPTGRPFGQLIRGHHDAGGLAFDQVLVGLTGGSGDPKMPRMSSRIWNASPMADP